jgi:hypothetical protein
MAGRYNKLVQSAHKSRTQGAPASPDNCMNANQHINRRSTSKEVNKEQPSYRNLSAIATRVLHAQLQLLGKIVRLLEIILLT